jgi:cytochrome c biogenesis protein CcmG, thiol:disulfide interchange protein DsbE
VVIIAAAVGYALTRPVSTPSFFASGPAQELPAAGRLTPLAESEFEGVLVGLRGTPVIVNIWASWCAPCRTEAPLLERTWRSHGGDVMILGVASRDQPDAALDFLEEFGVSYPNVFDTSGEIRRALGLRGFPTTYVFDAAGNLRTTIIGGVSEQRLAAVLDDLMA